MICVTIVDAVNDDRINLCNCSAAMSLSTCPQVKLLSNGQSDVCQRFFWISRFEFTCASLTCFVALVKIEIINFCCKLGASVSCVSHQFDRSTESTKSSVSLVCEIG